MGKGDAMRRWTGWMDWGLKVLIGLDFLILFVLNIGQIISRSFLRMSSVSIPDISRFLFIWLVFLGTAFIYNRKQHLVIEFVKLRLSRSLQYRLSLLTNITMMVFFAILIRSGWRMTMIRMDIPYTGWEIPTGYAYLAVPVCAFLMLLVTGIDLYERLRSGPSG